MKTGLVCSFPPIGKDHTVGDGGVSWYTANLLSEIPKDDLQYEVYANKLSGNPLTYQFNEHIKIIRCWDRGPFSVLQLISQIYKSRPDLVHIQHEIFQLGKGILAILTPLLFLAIKAMRIPVIVTLHGVPPLSMVDDPFIRRYGLHIPYLLVRVAFWIVIWPIVILADKVIVHMADCIQILAKEYGLTRYKHKMLVIPLGIEELEDFIDQEEAKRRLGLQKKQVILFFGHLTGYKGLELLIDSMGLLENKYHDLVLLIAGGDTPGIRVATGKHVYSDTLKERAQCVSPNIRFAGFVEEKDVGVYFAAADLVVLPYTIGLSSSGPLSIAATHNRPFIVSTALASVIDLNDAIFEPTVQSVAEKISRFFSDDDLRHAIMEYEQKIKIERSWTLVGDQTRKIYGDFLLGLN